MVAFYYLLCHHLVVLSRGDLMYFEQLKNLRTDFDKTQQEIADLLSCKREVYRRYEKGEREIPVWALIKLARYYNVSLDYLLGLTSKKEKFPTK